MRSLRIHHLIVALACLFAACGEPRRIHGDGGSGGRPGDGSLETGDVPQDVPRDQRPDTDLGGNGDGPVEMVVTAPAGSVEKGKPCSIDDNCASGSCRDDVCCEAKCEGTCVACSAAFTGLDNGVCGPVVSGMDPRGVCKDESDTSKCGQDGTCNGAGACRKQGPDRVCAPAGCAEGKFTAASTCDSKGTCVAGMVMSCGEFACAITGCAKPCTGDTDCPTGNYCSNGTCKIKKIAGESCENLNQCGSSYCSPDRVCCDTACTGACTACTETLTGQKNGTCAPVQAGKDPKDDCAAEAPKSCGRDGTCDGKGACRSYDSSVVCGEAGCTGSTFSPAATCDSKGACAPVTSVSCGQAACTAGGCSTACTTDAMCVQGSYCVKASGTCAPKKANGVACSAGECASGACIDGVCCESACQGKCYGCSSDLTGQPSGRCLPIKEGRDPQNECEDSESTTCQQDGTCDGRGQCRKWPSLTPCATPMCTADNKYLSARTCDGNGTCSAATVDVCGASKCELSGCKKACEGNSDCIGNTYCDTAVKSCAAQKSQGTACGADVQCVSQSCVDGVCCESACKSKCYACAFAKTTQPNGRCQPVAAGTDQDMECESSQENSCGQDGTCDGNGQCRLWGSSAKCGAAACSAGGFTPVNTCDGHGVCVKPAVMSCGLNTCDDVTGCRAACSATVACATGSYCQIAGGASTGVCMAKKATGDACGAGEECLMGFCADGVCCNEACTGTCNACVKALTGLTTSGVCGARAPGIADARCTNDGTTCGQDGKCDGGGKCRKAADGTQCKAAMCASNVYTGASTCNGQGTCVTPAAQSCAPSTCTNGPCITQCTGDGQCTSGSYCDGTTHMCAAKKSLGAVCAGTAECATGVCADGVCCNTTCDKACQACDLPGSMGTCTPKSSAPRAGHPTCAGADASCNGSCTGSADGQCTFPTTSCGSCKACSSGMCKAVVNQTNSSCAGICDASGVCKSERGQLCSTSAGGCVSGTVCAPDGICCDRACTGSCEACDIQGFAGTCKDVASGAPHSQHPTCGTDSACMGSCSAGQCAYSQNSCGSSTCVAGSYVPPGACDHGTCVTPSAQQCSGGFTCAGNTCRTTCQIDSDCRSGYFCGKNTCHSKAVSISAGDEHVCVALADGSVWCWGNNGVGQLGDGTKVDSQRPVKVTGVTIAKSVVAGSGHSCGLMADGSVSCWGINNFGQLGDGTVMEATAPTRVGLPVGVAATAIATATVHTCALLVDSTVRCWGKNDAGQLGNGTVSASFAPNPNPVVVLNLTSPAAIVLGYASTCALRTGGGVSCWGQNFFGTLGDGTTTNSSVPVAVKFPGNMAASSIGTGASGSEFHCAIMVDGTVQCWGANGEGGLGDGTMTKSLLPIPVKNLPASALSLAPGGLHACARLSDGSSRCWGDNFYGQLGNNMTANLSLAVAVQGLPNAVMLAAGGGGRHTCAIVENGSVKCWGHNNKGQLGTGNGSDSLVPSSVDPW